MLRCGRGVVVGGGHCVGLTRRCYAGEANLGGLCELNNKNDYDLMSKINLFYGNDENSNPYMNVNLTSSFIDTDL